MLRSSMTRWSLPNQNPPPENQLDVMWRESLSPFQCTRIFYPDWSSRFLKDSIVNVHMSLTLQQDLCEERCWSEGMPFLDRYQRSHWRSLKTIGIDVQRCEV